MMSLILHMLSSCFVAPSSTVVQIAKAEGLKVIASAGSEDKVEFLREIGADVAFNYKTTKIAEVLAKEGPINMLAVFHYLMRLHGDCLTGGISAATGTTSGASHSRPRSSTPRRRHTSSYVLVVHSDSVASLLTSLLSCSIDLREHLELQHKGAIQRQEPAADPLARDHLTRLPRVVARVQVRGRVLPHVLCPRCERRDQV